MATTNIKIYKKIEPLIQILIRRLVGSHTLLLYKQKLNIYFYPLVSSIKTTSPAGWPLIKSRVAWAEYSL